MKIGKIGYTSHLLFLKEILLRVFNLTLILTIVLSFSFTSCSVFQSNSKNGCCCNQEKSVCKDGKCAMKKDKKKYKCEKCEGKKKQEN